jgi:hypothetical protein
VTRRDELLAELAALPDEDEAAEVVEEVAEGNAEVVEAVAEVVEAVADAVEHDEPEAPPVEVVTVDHAPDEYADADAARIQAEADAQTQVIAAEAEAQVRVMEAQAAIEREHDEGGHLVEDVLDEVLPADGSDAIEVPDVAPQSQHWFFRPLRRRRS